MPKERDKKVLMKLTKFSHLVSSSPEVVIPPVEPIPIDSAPQSPPITDPASGENSALTGAIGDRDENTGRAGESPAESKIADGVENKIEITGGAGWIASGGKHLAGGDQIGSNGGNGVISASGGLIINNGGDGLVTTIGDHNGLSDWSSWSDTDPNSPLFAWSDTTSGSRNAAGVANGGATTWSSWTSSDPTGKITTEVAGWSSWSSGQTGQTGELAQSAVLTNGASASNSAGTDPALTSGSSSRSSGVTSSHTLVTSVINETIVKPVTTQPIVPVISNHSSGGSIGNIPVGSSGGRTRTRLAYASIDGSYS